ncbi:hypothetical protein HDU98_003200, partial [Podochytrium sp. JEL0797]
NVKVICDAHRVPFGNITDFAGAVRCANASKGVAGGLARDALAVGPARDALDMEIPELTNLLPSSFLREMETTFGPNRIRYHITKPFSGMLFVTEKPGMRGTSFTSVTYQSVKVICDKHHVPYGQVISFSNALECANLRRARQLQPPDAFVASSPSISSSIASAPSTFPNASSHSCVTQQKQQYPPDSPLPHPSPTANYSPSGPAQRLEIKRTPRSYALDALGNRVEGENRMLQQGLLRDLECMFGEGRLCFDVGGGGEGVVCVAVRPEREVAREGELPVKLEAMQSVFARHCVMFGEILSYDVAFERATKGQVEHEQAPPQQEQPPQQEPSPQKEQPQQQEQPPKQEHPTGKQEQPPRQEPQQDKTPPPPPSLKQDQPTPRAAAVTPTTSSSPSGVTPTKQYLALDSLNKPIPFLAHLKQDFLAAMDESFGGREVFCYHVVTPYDGHMYVAVKSRSGGSGGGKSWGGGGNPVRKITHEAVSNLCWKFGVDFGGTLPFDAAVRGLLRTQTRRLPPNATPGVPMLAPDVKWVSRPQPSLDAGEDAGEPGMFPVVEVFESGGWGAGGGRAVKFVVSEEGGGVRGLGRGSGAGGVDGGGAVASARRVPTLGLSSSVVAGSGGSAGGGDSTRMAPVAAVVNNKPPVRKVSSGSTTSRGAAFEALVFAMRLGGGLPTRAFDLAFAMDPKSIQRAGFANLVQLLEAAAQAGVVTLSSDGDGGGPVVTLVEGK